VVVNEIARKHEEDEEEDAERASVSPRIDEPLPTHTGQLLQLPLLNTSHSSEDPSPNNTLLSPRLNRLQMAEELRNSPSLNLDEIVYDTHRRRPESLSEDEWRMIQRYFFLWFKQMISFPIWVSIQKSLLLFKTYFCNISVSIFHENRRTVIRRQQQISNQFLLTLVATHLVRGILYLLLVDNQFRRIWMRRAKSSNQITTLDLQQDKEYLDNFRRLHVVAYNQGICFTHLRVKWNHRRCMIFGWQISESWKTRWPNDRQWKTTCYWMASDPQQVRQGSFRLFRQIEVCHRWVLVIGSCRRVIGPRQLLTALFQLSKCSVRGWRNC
jgi:hypothetical protein